MLPLVPILLEAAQLVPTISKFFGSPETVQKVADGVGDIAKALVPTAQSAEEAMKQVIQNEQLKQQFQIQVNDQMLKWEQMYLDDMESARDRDVKLAQAGVKNTRANMLAVFAVSTVIICLCIVVWMSNINEFAKGMITLICGRALGWVEQIFSFEFGTTKSSKQKDDLIKTLAGDK